MCNGKWTFKICAKAEQFIAVAFFFLFHPKSKHHVLVSYVSNRRTSMTISTVFISAFGANLIFDLSALWHWMGRIQWMIKATKMCFFLNLTRGELPTVLTLNLRYSLSSGGRSSSSGYCCCNGPLTTTLRIQTQHIHSFWLYYTIWYTWAPTAKQINKIKSQFGYKKTKKPSQNRFPPHIVRINKILHDFWEENKFSIESLWALNQNTYALNLTCLHVERGRDNTKCMKCRHWTYRSICVHDVSNATISTVMRPKRINEKKEEKRKKHFHMNSSGRVARELIDTHHACMRKLIYIFTQMRFEWVILRIWCSLKNSISKVRVRR